MQCHMMVSPEGYRHKHINDNLTDLTLEQKRLKREINRLQKEIEDGELPKILIKPSRELVLKMDKLYLKEIEELISIREKKI